MRVALHRHPGVAGVVESAAEILTAVPGIELVDLNQPAVDSTTPATPGCLCSATRISTLR